jgi:hypothetical protein
VLVETTVIAKVAAVVLPVEAKVAAVMAEVHSIVTNFHPIATEVAIKTGAALGLGSNAYEEGGGKEDG